MRREKFLVLKEIVFRRELGRRFFLVFWGVVFCFNLVIEDKDVEEGEIKIF